MSTNLTTRTMSGLKWSYLGTLVNALFQIGFTAVMARLLDPASYGLVAMAGMVLGFGSYFAQMGIGTALIQKHRIEEEDIRASFTSSLLLGIVFFALLWVSAPLMLYVFDTRDIVPVVRVLALSFVLNGLSATSLSLLKREMRFRAISFIEIASFVLSYGGIGLPLAIAGFGVWSLVCCTLSQSLLSALFGYLYRRHSMALFFGKSRYAELFAYGGKLSVVGFTQYLGLLLNPFVVGRYFGAPALGIYNNASRLANLPIENLTVALTRVLFPSLSLLQYDLPRVKEAYISMFFIVGLVVGPISFSMVVAADDIVLALLGPKWREAVPILRILAFAVPFSMLKRLSGTICDSTAQLGMKLKNELLYVILMLIFIAVVFPFGLAFVAAAYTIGEIVNFMAYQFLLRDIIGLKLEEIKGCFLVIFINSGFVAGSVGLCSFVLHYFNFRPVNGLLLEILTGIIALYMVTLVKNHKMIRQELTSIYQRLVQQREVTTRLDVLIDIYAKKHLRLQIP